MFFSVCQSFSAGGHRLYDGGKGRVSDCDVHPSGTGVQSFSFQKEKQDVSMGRSFARSVRHVSFTCKRRVFFWEGSYPGVRQCCFIQRAYLCCDHFVRLGSPIRISAIQFLTTAVISGVAALLLETPDMEKIFSAIIPIFYCGIVSGGIGYTLQMVGQRFTEPVIASLILSLESVFAVLAGAVVLHERMSMREIFGCVILFAAILLVQMPKRADSLFHS